MNYCTRRQIMTSRYRRSGWLLATGSLLAITGVGSVAITTAQEHVDSPHRHDGQTHELLICTQN